MTQGKLAIVTLALALGLSACATARNPRDRIVQRPAACPDQTAQIYFEADSAEITKEGRALLAATAGDRKACRVTGVEVMGLADAAGAPGANLELSARRARAVTAALAASGLPAAEFKVSAAGQAGATTARGQAQPLRRRVDLIVHQAPL